MRNYSSNHLSQLEDEGVHILRETAAQFQRPVLLFSGGKDSIVVAHLAQKAFWPGRMPFPLMHVDTGHNFPETIAFRDDYVKRLRARLIIASVQVSIDRGRVKEEKTLGASRNGLQTVTLLDAIKENGFDAAIGGARRDEEKARAKERIFSHRDEYGQWDPKNQRPELWSIFNGQMAPGEHFRVFPLSNWTELDVWQYLKREDITLPSLYFAHRRALIKRGDFLLADCEHVKRGPDDEAIEMDVRFRTIGDVTCTGATPSTATDLNAVIAEVATARKTERGNRGDDRRSESAMEDRKRAGYF